MPSASLSSALRDGRVVRRGQGYSLQITAPSLIHHTLLRALTDLDDRWAGPAERTAYRTSRCKHPRAAPG